jgi:hypothetical protein
MKVLFINSWMKKIKLLYVAIIFFSSCWHEQWEDRLANGDMGTVTHGPKSMAPDTSGHKTYGKNLFDAQCSSCHNNDSPLMRGVLKRIPSKEELYAFIRNADSVIKSGDAYANEVYTENNKIMHPKYPKLKNEEIDSILDYCENSPQVRKY